MSHFTVAVLSNSRHDIESLLAPYNEQTEDPQYQEFEPTGASDELLAEYEKHRDKYPTFEEFCKCYYGYIYDEESGMWGYVCNPNAKWDWYMIGGRWSNSLRLKPGCEGYMGTPSWGLAGTFPQEGRCDQALLKNVDLSPDPDEYEKAVRFWEVFVEKQPLKEGENERDFFDFHAPEYYIKLYGTKERYAEQQAEFSTWALVTPDGEWYEKGQMGWFGMSDATAESISEYRAALNKVLAENPDVWITIVDCHI
jgi:hypothetical protein